MGWRDQAACRDTQDDVFFEPDLAHIAKAYCNRCDVQQECLSYALNLSGSDKATVGVWGGKTVSERLFIKREIRNLKRRASR